MSAIEATLPSAPLDVQLPNLPAYIFTAAEAAEVEHARSGLGDRSKFRAEVIMKLLVAIREGAHYEPACAIAGVSYRGFRDWMIKAEDEGESSPFGIVASAVKVAEAEAEVETVQDVRRASRDPRFWAAGMTFLERRHPDRWKRRDDNTLQVNVGVAIGVQASEDTRRQIVPTVIVQSAESLGIMAPAHRVETLSPALESSPALSPASGMAVSEARPEAKATPTDRVSPPKVA